MSKVNWARLLVLLLKWYTEVFIKTFTETTGFAIRAIILNLSLNGFKNAEDHVMIWIWLNFVHLIIILVGRKKIVAHISKDTFVTDRMYLNINAQQRKNISVLVVGLFSKVGLLNHDKSLNFSGAFRKNITWRIQPFILQWKHLWL